ncbi:hypothetical protein [Salegentibacter sp. F14]
MLKMTIRNWTRLINCVGAIAAALLFFYPVYYKTTVILNVLIVIIAILFAFLHKGKVGIDSRKCKNTPIPKIDPAILLPSFALILRALFDIKIIGFKNIFFFALIISIPLIYLLFNGTKEYLSGKKIFTGIFWAILFTSTFGCGTTILANALLDKSEPEIYKSKIIKKEVEKGKTNAYRIDLEPWGLIRENDFIRISKTEFEKLNINDSIDLELRKGFLNTPWIKLP